MPRSPFRVQVATLLRRPGTRQVESRQGMLAGLFVTGSRVPSGSEIGVDAVLESVHSGILVSARVSAPWEGDCRRCLEQAVGRLSVEVRELFEPGADPETGYPLNGDQLDLEPMARDAVVLELPLAPLCRSACEGLCPQCGADLNQTRCRCEHRARDPRWSALDVLGSQPGGPPPILDRTDWS